MNRELFHYFMARNRDSKKTLADALGMHEITLYNKLNDTAKSQFTLTELKAIKERWNLTQEDFCAIFFDKEIA